MLSESDLNLLEAYLDDALSASDVQRLDTRLTDNPQLSAAFDTLRRERAARVSAFQAMAPTPDEANRFAENSLSSIYRRQRNMQIVRNLRLVGSLAACLLVGFAIGRIGRAPVSLPEKLIVSPSAPSPSSKDTHLVIHTPSPAEPGQFQVAVLDEAGNVIALQRFTKLEDARQFADDLGQYESRRRQVQESQAMLVSDRF